ncbi:MAG: gephyrin-like molybdotransferase Glp [bacterium]
MGRGQAVSVGEALRLLFNLPVNKTFPERTPLEAAYGRILSSDIVAREDMPGFARSTVDGYAVKASDTFGCSETVPAYLTLRGEVRMGESASVSLGPGDAISIPTGGMLPRGADAVVMLEHVQTSGGDVLEILRPVAPAENVIRADEDVSKGERVLGLGHRLRPQDVAALAGMGITEVPVYGRPAVAIVSTGDEIVPARSAIRPGQVRDVNSFNLAGLIQDAGGVAKKMGIFPDDYTAISGAVKEALDSCDMVLVTGGSSVGLKDMTARIFEDIEKGSVIFHGVAVKPGKPLIAGLVKGKPVFGLPGHPAAVTLSFLNFVRPILLKMAGYEPGPAENYFDRVTAILAKNISSAPGREDHIRVSLFTKDGTLYAEPIFGKSGLIKTLVLADGIVVVPAEAQGIARDEMVEVRVFRR